MATENIYLSPGSTFAIGSGADDIKSIIVDEPVLTVGEAGEIQETAHDGTTYSFTDEIGSNSFETTVLTSIENFNTVMNSIYGTGSVVGDVTTWDMSNPGGTTNDITITLPSKTGGGTTNQIKYKAINAKGLVAQPLLPIKGGAKMRIKFTCDRWDAILDLSP